MTQQEQYWKERCEAAENFINESYCDLVTDEQVESHNEWLYLKNRQPPAPAQGVEEAILALQKAIQMAEHNSEDPLVTSWPEQTGVLISLSDAKKLLSGSRWQQGHESMGTRSTINAGSIDKPTEGYIGDRIRKEMKGFYSFNHPARKTFDDVCWRLYGMPPDSLFENFRNNTSAFWLDIILPAMQEYADKNSPTIGADSLKKYIEDRIAYLKKAGAEACNDRWDMTKPLFVRSIARDHSNFFTERRHELEYLLKMIPDNESLAPSIGARWVSVEEVSSLRWLLNIGRERPKSQIGNLLNNVFDKNGIENVKHLENLWAKISSGPATFPTRELAETFANQFPNTMEGNRQMHGALAMYDWIFDQVKGSK